MGKNWINILGKELIRLKEDTDHLVESDGGD